MATPRSIAKRMVSVCEKLWHHGDEALSLAKEAQSPVRARNYAAGRTSKGDVSDKTSETACSRADRGTSLYDRLVKGLDDLDGALVTVDGLLNRVFHKADRAAAKRELRRSGEGDCVACGGYCAGGENDRIKSGLCPRHYRGMLRAQSRGTDRIEYIDNVKRQLRAGDSDA